MAGQRLVRAGGSTDAFGRGPRWAGGDPLVLPVVRRAQRTRGGRLPKLWSERTAGVRRALEPVLRRSWARSEGCHDLRGLLQVGARRAWAASRAGCLARFTRVPRRPV